MNNSQQQPQQQPRQRQQTEKVMKGKQSGIFSMFCIWGKREERTQSPRRQGRIQSVMQKPKQNTTERSNTQDNSNQEYSQQFAQSTCDMMDNVGEYENHRDSNLFNILEESNEFQGSLNIYEETKTSGDEGMLIHEGNGLLVKLSNFSDDQQKRRNEQYHSYILRVMNQEKEFNDITPQQEVQFTKQLVPSIISDQVMSRVRQDTVLVAHDPTGCFLVKHLTHSQLVYYIEDSKTYTPIINKAVALLNLRHRLFRVVKSEINQVLDTAIINLMYHCNMPISGIMREYLNMTHDIILILSPCIAYRDIITQVQMTLQYIEQSKTYCSIELQDIQINGKVIARILYYGEVSQITQNQQLNYLYSWMSPNVKRTYKYKAYIRKLRNQLGITKIVALFHQYGLINNTTDAPFIDLYRATKSQYFPLIKSQKFIDQDKIQQVDDDRKSSTESESEADGMLPEIDAIPTKYYSKSTAMQPRPPRFQNLYQSCNTQYNRDTIVVFKESIIS